MPFLHLRRLIALAAINFISFCVCVGAAEFETGATDSQVSPGLKNPGTRRAAPEIEPASPEGEQAVLRMKLPPGLTASLWAAEPMLANPVAFNFDERGRIFVAETYRYGSSVLDIRDYLWMLEDDLACRTIEDRTKLIAKKFGPAGVKELSLESELVRVLEDRDHDGKADYSAVYATGFNSPLDGVGAGVLARRGEVWFANIPSLWRFTGIDHAETRTELSRGYGVRFNYTGHDLHGLTFGPDGKIYFTCGDRGSHVPTKEGGVIDIPDTGAVFRCNPDGTQLELFASGLRNPQSLLFTENGDLFTGDNDCDQGDEERLVHIVEGGDSGWRVGYQFAPLGNAGPWNSEKMWHPRHASQAAFIIPPICNIEDGPSGIAYYPGTGLNSSYAGAIFITHFKGSIARSGIYAYYLKPQGASYAIADAKPFLTSALPTDVKFGPDGRLYYSDWAEGWPKSKRGRIYAISDPAHINDPIIKETQALIASDFTKKSADELANLLGHADWRVRLEAQYTLAERGDSSIPILTGIATKTDANHFARLHAIWGLGELADKNPAALAQIPLLLRDRDGEVRAQSAKLIGDHHVNAVGALVSALTSDTSADRLKFFAAQSLGKLHAADAAPALLAALRNNDDRDSYLRHACVMGLVGGNNLAALIAASQDPSRAVRLGVLLAFRRLGRPEIERFLADPDLALVREAALAINDVPISEALPALAAMVRPVADQPYANDEPVMLRAINANFRLGRSENATALAAYAASATAPEKFRGEALTQLALWAKPPARDRIVGVFRPLAANSHDAAVARDAFGPVVGRIIESGTPESVQIAALATIGKLEVRAAADTVFALISDSSRVETIRAAALKVLDGLNDPRLPEAVTSAGNSDASLLRLAALPIAARLSPDAAAPLLARLVTEGDAAEQKAAYKTLATFRHSTVDPLLAAQLRKLRDGKIPFGAQLELLEAAGKRSDPEVKKLLAERETALAAAGDPLASYRVALEGGDAKRGEKIFYTQPVMACVRCHNAGEGGGDAGPNLAQVGARQTREYLLESIVKPNAKIARGFDTIVVTLRSGNVVGGVIANETAETIGLRNADGKVVDVKKAEVLKRDGAPSSMPEIFGAVLTKTELRDVVEFLASLKTPARENAEDNQPRALRHWKE